eukprot:CAMPEP_0195280952 /NCGR_PEP_ID=MMETSP0707-20130614/457_1 /TAXON_ID=33640 /ORGANISM="Asterionellopsis glacialis, Strain CCMP134" /LENGTH=607 /DNA_ID=CAMNT_0040339783 /DNA_START=74 /DNA_END=1897 /DNA_ORIENTATION=-
MRFFPTSIICALVFLANACAEKQIIPLTDCPLDCDASHSNVCIEGEADFSNHPQPNGAPLEFHEETKDSTYGLHCNCTEGRTGLKCKRQYESCHNNDDMKCYNGGACLLGGVDQFGNDQYYCDCKNAKDEKGNLYYGQYCENKVLEVCDGSQDVFCVNGGTCKDDYESSPHRPCLCGPDYDGKHCEFRKDDFPKCDLTCENGGQCQLGIKTYKQAMLGYDTFWQNTENFMYCACKPGFFGLDCEVKSNLCGEHHCFNGGSCKVKTLADGVTTKRHCDCTTAGTHGKSYSGMYCEYQSTSFCGKNPDHNGHQFCVNGGTCESTLETHLGCRCPHGYTGPICEFSEKSAAVVENLKCSTKCLNGGRCRKGSKDLSYLKKMGITAPHLQHQTTQDNNEHCVCPKGFLGVHCETSIDECSEEHVCLHGSKCIKKGDGHECDCEKADGVVAGKFCEHKQTTVCTVDPGSIKASKAFCVNNGECVDIIGPTASHAGCKCPKGFNGEHCEYTKPSSNLMNEQQPSSESDSSTGSVGSMYFFTAVAVVLVFSVIGVVLFISRKGRHQETVVDESEDWQSPQHSPYLDEEPLQDSSALANFPKDFDDEELKDIELI